MDPYIYTWENKAKTISHNIRDLMLWEAYSPEDIVRFFKNRYGDEAEEALSALLNCIKEYTEALEALLPHELPF